MSLASYFAPTYFTTFYFPPLAQSAGGNPSSVVIPYRDRDAYAAIVGALDATGEFSRIVLGAPPDEASAGAGYMPLAVVVPTEWDEVDDVDPIVNIRHVNDDLILIVRDEDAERRFEMLDRLTSIAQNAIDGSNLNGVCLGDWTKLRRGRYNQGSRHPEQSVTLMGEYAYLVESHTGHDTSA